MTTEQEKKIFQELIKEGYSAKESRKILQGHKEIKEKKGISAEEIYKHLLAKQKVYA